MGVLNFITFGYANKREAKEIVADSKEKYKDYINEMNIAEDKKNEDFEKFGLLKKNIFENEVPEFAEYYKSIGNIKVNDFYIDPIFKKELDLAIYEANKVTTSFKELGSVAGGGALTGATLAYGAFGLAGMIGTASTGTAIGTLSGAVATKASLAWLGGGALSAGGAGVTGGMLVLGGVAIAPIAVIGMFFGANKGKKELNDAKNYADSVEVIIERIKTAIDELSKIRRSVHLVSETLISLQSLLAKYNQLLIPIIKRLEERSFINKFIIDPIKNKIFKIDILTEDEIKIFMDASNIFETLRKISNIAIIDENGAFLSISQETFNIEIESFSSKWQGDLIAIPK